MNSTRRAWQLHGALLAALIAFYFYVFGEVLFSPPRGGFDLSGFAAVMSLFLLIAYVLVTTAVMPWVGRRTWAPLVMHAALAGTYIAAVALEDREKDRRHAELAQQAEAEARRRPENCVALELRAIRGAPPRAAIELHSTCEAPVVIERVDLVGFPPDGGNTYLDDDEAAERPRTTLQPGQRATFTLRSTVERAIGDGWHWRSNVSFDSSMTCFTTPDAPATGGCAAIRRVSLDQR